MGRKAKAAEPERGHPVARFFSGLRSFFFGREVDEKTGERLREIKGLVLVGFALFVFLALVSFYAPFEDPAAQGSNWGGQVGFYLANGLHRMLGLASLLLALLAIIWGAVLVAGRKIPLVSLRCIGGMAFVFSTAYLLHFMFGPEVHAAGSAPLSNVGSRLPYGPGGWLAMESTPFFISKFGGVGFFLMLIVLAVVSFLLATEMGFYPSVQGFQEWLKKRREERGEGLLAAVGGHLRTVGVGAWNFVRGADLSEGLKPAAQTAGGGTAVLEEEQEAPRQAVKRTNRTAKPEEDEDEAEEVELEEDTDSLAELDEDEEEADEDEEEKDLGLGDNDDPKQPKKGVYDEDELDDDYEQEMSDEEFEPLPEEEEEEEPKLVPIAPAAEARKPIQPKLPQGPRFDTPTPPAGPWKLPPLDLLIKPEGGGQTDAGFVQECATKLENALKSFRVEANVVGAQIGPAVTMFELSVAQGTRMNRVTQLSSEIAAALRAQSVRIIAPIPGRDTIGIEVPNSKRRVVRIRELVTQAAYDSKQFSLPLFLGMDAEGGPVVGDLARMPHLLIAGTTGSGKSVCINTILASLLMTRSPEEVKMILVDPKMVELQTFASVPHLMCPVVTDARQATQVLLWAVEKMEGRYELFKDAGVKNIKGYNALGEAELRKRLGQHFDEARTPRQVPYIVVVIDEMADLMMTSKKEAEQAITRLAQKSRAVGIHVIVATQRPSTDVITGVLKGNLPTRIAFQVASKIDSRVILDDSGADKLLGNGDMLFMPPGGSKLKRVQGALVEDSELSKLVEFVAKDSAQSFSQELVQVATGAKQAGGEMSGSMPDEDELFDDAVRVILKTKRGSASLLQRALGIGYTRASRLIDIMTEHGIVGPHKGSKSREILMTLEDWEKAYGVKEIHAPNEDNTNDD